MRPRLHAALCFAFIGLCLVPVAQAADWLTVASDRVRRVELDRASITPAEAGSKVAWGRIVLSNDQANAYGYRTVRALNRYDCRRHSFVIVKRVYLSNDDSVLREDQVEATTAISVKTGTVDDRFFNEVCKPASVADLRDTAKQAAERLAETAMGEKNNDRNSDRESNKPALRRADIQLTRDEPPAPNPTSPTKPVLPELTAPKEPTAPVGKPMAIKPAARSMTEASSPTAAPARRPAVMAKAMTKELAKEPTKESTKESTKETKELIAKESISSVPPVAGSIAPAPVLTVPVSPAARALSAAEREAQRIDAENAAARAAQRVSAISKSHKKAPPVSMWHPPAPPAIEAAATTPAPESHDLHWGYEGAEGPENWSKLDPEFSVCSIGKRQSPIDIRDGIKVDQEPIQFDYKPSFFRIVDNGHTIQVSYGAGSHITIMGRTYELVQLLFHHPAEERINGKGFAMAAHLVHRDPEGRLAVVAILLEAGQANNTIQTLWNNLPLEKSEDYAPSIAIQAADLLPQKRDYFSYIGSLTTPPCTEGVLWLVMKQPMQLSAEQIDVFSRFYPNNARPIQATSGRIIKESR